MADFFLLHRQTHVLFHRSSSGPLAVVEAGAPAAPAKANMNDFIDPLERGSKSALLRCRNCSSSVCSCGGRAGGGHAGAGPGGGRATATGVRRRRGAPNARGWVSTP
jgi:hypothetical protein